MIPGSSNASCPDSCGPPLSIGPPHRNGVIPGPTRHWLHHQLYFCNYGPGLGDYFYGTEAEAISAEQIDRKTDKKLLESYAYRRIGGPPAPGAARIGATTMGRSTRAIGSGPIAEKLAATLREIGLPDQFESSRKGEKFWGSSRKGICYGTESSREGRYVGGDFLCSKGCWRDDLGPAVFLIRRGSIGWRVSLSKGYRQCVSGNACRAHLISVPLGFIFSVNGILGGVGPCCHVFSHYEVILSTPLCGTDPLAFYPPMRGRSSSIPLCGDNGHGVRFLER